MGGLLTILLVAVGYAIIRANHDRYLRQGEWKTWAFIEGLVIAFAISFLVGGRWYEIGVGTLLFGFTFWIIFDIVMGIYFGNHPLYVGETSFDLEMRKMFQYTEKWKGTWYLMVKLVWWLFAFYLYYTFGFA